MDIIKVVSDIKERCLSGGQSALLELTKKFDQLDLDSLVFEIPDDIKIDEALASAILKAKDNIYKFHLEEYKKLLDNKPVQLSNQINCFKKFTAIENVGIYIPNGLFSSLLMTVIPAQIVGCKDITICTPANVSDVILYVCKILGVKKIFRLGGAQAIFAMAYGVGEISKVDKIFGPGNEYVDAAKKMVSNQVAIDMPAGPSEVLVIADDEAKTNDVIYDLLAQLEHGKESKAWLFTTSDRLLSEVKLQINQVIKTAKRANILECSINNLVCRKFENIKSAIDESNKIAPEHLILNVEKFADFIDLITNAGSVFLGRYTTESLGDYYSGSNHVLPTSGFAHSFSGLSCLSFGKFITFQEIKKDDLENVARAVSLMANAEGLEMHAKSILSRVNMVK